ncbi:MAG: glycosyltransferase family 2 protein [Pseudomonadota bacterium]
MNLSLVIPVWNDEAGLHRLLKQVGKLAVFDEVIVVDDGSSNAVDQEAARRALKRNKFQLRVVRSETQRGAGHARNLGLSHVTSSHVLFFDSDDLLTEKFPTLVKDLIAQDEEFDFCIFQHIENRLRKERHIGPFHGDIAQWSAAGAEGHLTWLDPNASPKFAKITAYPWNKIYRTEFLYRYGIRCTETPVHNDIELHWLSFLYGTRILVSDMLCAEHFVKEGGQHLTNRSGLERVHLITALERVAEEIDAIKDGHRFEQPFVEFYLDLFGWALERISPRARSTFRSKRNEFVEEHMSRQLFMKVNLANPDAGERIINIFNRSA